MGMDIFLVEYLGKDDDGYLKTKFVEKEYKWDSSRYSVRHRFAKEVKQDELCSGKYMDHQAYYRPSNFEEAFKWSKTLDKNEKEYIDNILNILKSKETLYLEYVY